MATFSRISKKNQDKAVKQSLIFSVLGILIIIAFVFAIFPLSIRIYDFFKKDTATFTETDTTPPQVPVIISLPEATNSASLTISGYGEPSSTMKLLKNDIGVSDTTANDDGSYSFGDIFFSEGEHVLQVVSSDTAANESKSQTQTLIIDLQPPTLNIEQPTNDLTITRRREQVIPIKGITDAKARVYVNDKMLLVDSAGNFSGQFSLQENENILQLKAVDLAGNETLQEIKVYFRP